MLSQRIRAGGGLGDALYLQSVVRHLVNSGNTNLEVCTKWEDVFLPLQGKIKLAPFSREKIDILAHYTRRKHLLTKQFDDSCIIAGINEPVELKLDWLGRNSDFVKKIKLSKKPNLAVLTYRYPMDRADGFAEELLPSLKVFNYCLSILQNHFNIVLVGAGEALAEYNYYDIDFRNQTTVRDLIDIVSKCDAVFSYCSFMIPLAESLNKKALFCWSRKGLRSSTEYIKQITPEKILHKSSSSYIVDNWDVDKMEDTLNEFICK